MWQFRAFFRKEPPAPLPLPPLPCPRHLLGILTVTLRTVLRVGHLISPSPFNR